MTDEYKPLTWDEWLYGDDWNIDKVRSAVMGLYNELGEIAALSETSAFKTGLWVSREAIKTWFPVFFDEEIGTEEHHD